VAAFEAEFDFVRRTLRRQGVAASDVDDLMQEVFIALWRAWAQFDQSRPLRPWLWGITFRVARSHLRRRWREIPRNDIEIADEGDPGEDSAAAARALVLSALARLPVRHRTTLILHELDGIPTNQLAEQLSMPLASVYTRVRRARLAFAEVVGELQGTAAAGAPLDADALLEFERNPPPAPERVRSLVMAGIRALPPPAPRWWVRPVAVGAGLLVLASAGALVWRRSSVSLRPTAATEGPVPRTTAARSPARPVIPALALERELVGHWRFDEGPGRPIRDHSNQGRDCRLRDRRRTAEWIDGQQGGALELGAQAWLDCPQPAADRPALSVAAWVKLKSVVAHHTALATRQIETGFEDHFFLGFEGDRLRFNSQAWKTHLLTGPLLTTGRWFHVAFTHDAQGLTRLYLDGVEVAQRQGGTGDARPVSASLTLGAGQYSRNPNLVRQRLDGALDEVRVYGRAVDAAEVAALAQRR
jgi:RNA polymerase sigma factor (sigma-70 family)